MPGEKSGAKGEKTGAQGEEQGAADTRLAVQMGDLVRLAQEFPAELALRKFGPDKTAAMAGALREYQRDRDGWLAGRGKRVFLTERVNEAMREVLRYRRDLADARRLLVKHRQIAAPPVHQREGLAGSAIRCLRWMVEVRPSVETLLELLSTALDRPLARLDELIGELTGAVAEQQAAEKELKRQALALARSRGELQRLTELLRFSGRIAFRDRPDLLRRLRRQPSVPRRKRAAA